jgi:4-amino-4-deoxy-L-arabinose transferase-like glycosyltransferase
MMSQRLTALRRILRPLLPGAGLWLLLSGMLLWLHRAWPPDETRLLAVAWEMWSQHFTLIPVLNNQVDATQMPMVPWLLMLMWKAFGVHAWCLQVLGAVFGLATLMVSSRIATYLWMDQIEMPRYVPVILMGTWFWIVALGIAPQASALAFFVSLAILGILRAWRYSTRAGWLVFGLATGAAILTSGLVALVYVLPVALAGPLWAGREHALLWRHWYLDLGSGAGLALGVVVLWGMLVVNAYGMDYALAYLAGALPVSSAFWPQHWPRYTYLLLPLPLLLPWAAWPLVYQRLWHALRQHPGIGAGFVLWWVLPALVLLMLITVPQPQWLVPLMPAGAMIIAYPLLNEELFDHTEGRLLLSLIPPLVIGGFVVASAAPLLSGAWVGLVGADHILYAGLAAAGIGVLAALLPRLSWPLRTVLVVAGLLTAAVSVLPTIPVVSTALSQVPPWAGIVAAVVAVVSAWTPQLSFHVRIIKIGALNLVLALALLAGAGVRLFPSSVLDGPAALLSAAQARGEPIAHVGTYDGRYSFAARLQKPVVELGPGQVAQWAARHPGGVVVADTIPLDPPAAPAFEARSLRGQVRVWRANTLASFR